jgi:hypothetical protein
MKQYILPLTLFALALVVFSTGCADRGCTDPAAENYDPFAQRNDGNCIYRGCTDPNSSNYDPQANVSDGSCLYNGTVSFWSSVSCCAIEVSLDGLIVDTIQQYYDINPGCVNGVGIVRLDRPIGSHIVSAQTLTGQSYLWSDTISIQANDCLTYEFSL